MKALRILGILLVLLGFNCRAEEIVADENQYIAFRNPGDLYEKDQKNRILYTEGMTLWDVYSEAKPHPRLWIRKVTIRIKGKEKHSQFNFRYLKEEDIELKMERIQIQIGDEIIFHEQAC